MSGIVFQFLPELESEARLMISNLLPYIHYHYGENATQCFTPSAVERLADCRWDTEAGSIVGTYDEEINYLDESDLMTKYISTKTPTPHNTNKLATPPKKATPSTNPTKLHNTAYGNDEDSVSTLGNQTA